MGMRIGISIMMGLIDVDMHSRSFSEELFPSGVAQRAIIDIERTQFFHVR